MHTTNTQHDNQKRGQPKSAGHAEATLRKSAKPQSKTILWSEWWPFERATGTALKQLNKPQRATLNDVEDAPI